jgi:hypothetical protein
MRSVAKKRAPLTVAWAFAEYKEVTDHEPKNDFAQDIPNPLKFL